MHADLIIGITPSQYTQFGSMIGVFIPAFLSERSITHKCSINKQKVVLNVVKNPQPDIDRGFVV